MTDKSLFLIDDADYSSRMQSSIYAFMDNIRTIRTLSTIGHQSQMAGIVGVLNSLGRTKIKPDDGNVDIEVNGIDKDGYLSIRIAPTEKAPPNVKSTIRDYHLHMEAAQLAGKSAVINIASTVEWFLGDLIRAFYHWSPSEYKTLVSEDTFTLGDLLSTPLTSDLITERVNRKIDRIFRDSFKAQLEFINDKITPVQSLIHEDAYELFQRRNLLVHNRGLVNKQYIAEAPKRYKDLKEQAPFENSVPYVESALHSVVESLLKVAYAIWRSTGVEPMDREAFYSDLIFHLLIEKGWALAEKLCKFIQNDKTARDDTRHICTFNLWLCLKRQGRLKEIEAKIQKFNPSMFSLKFVVARLALLGVDLEAFTILGTALDSSQITVDELLTWPILEEFREHEFFREFASARNIKIESHDSLFEPDYSVLTKPKPTAKSKEPAKVKSPPVAPGKLDDPASGTLRPTNSIESKAKQKAKANTEEKRRQPAKKATAVAPEKHRRRRGPEDNHDDTMLLSQ